MSSAILLHRLEEGAEAELSAPAVCSTQSGFLGGLFLSLLLQSLLTLNKRNINKWQSRNLLCFWETEYFFLLWLAPPVGRAWNHTTSWSVRWSFGLGLVVNYLSRHSLRQKIDTFFIPVDTAASWRAERVNHCTFSLCQPESFKQRVWTTYVWWMWEKMWTTCKWQRCIISSCAWPCAHDRDIRITSPTYWRRLWVRLAPSIRLISAHRTFFSSTLSLLCSCGTQGNSQRPASKPVQK